MDVPCGKKNNKYRHMKYLVYITFTLSILISSCQKVEPEIVKNDELSSLNYSGKIFSQAVRFDDQVVMIINNENKNELTSYDATGDIVWITDIEDYIIPGNTYEDITYLETKLSPTGDIVLNMMDDTQRFKSVQFSSTGSYLNQFSDVINQTDTLFIGNDTIDLNGESYFGANGVFSLSNGSNIAVSSWTPDYVDRLVDTTIVQISLYSNTGQFVHDRYIILNEELIIYDVFASSTDELIFVTEDYNEDVYIYIYNLQGNSVRVSQRLPIFGVYSFFENNAGEFIFSAGTFNNNGNYVGMLFSLNKQAKTLWSVSYSNNSAWIFTSMQQMDDGYLFTGFNIHKVLLNLDWRDSFNADNVKAIILKTNLKGVEQNSSLLQTMSESTVGAATLGNGNITFFGGKYDRSIHSTIILKLDKDLKIIK